MKAGKDLKISQDIKILKTIVKWDVIEDKIELWDSFDYKYIDVGETKSNVFRLINMGMKVLLKYSKIYGYYCNLSIYNEDKNWEEWDPSFDSKEKLFGNNEDVSLWAYVNILIQQGEEMLSKYNKKIKIQVVPSHVWYTIDNISEHIMNYSSDENYLKKIWGRKPTTIYYNFLDFKLEEISAILCNEPTINKINLKYYRVYFTEFESLLAFMEKNQTQKAFYSYFEWGNSTQSNTQIDIYSDLLVFKIKDSIFLTKIDANRMTIGGVITDMIKIDNDDFLLIKLDYMKSFNFSFQNSQDTRFTNNSQILNLNNLCCSNKDKFVLLRAKDINKISNITIESLEIISQVSSPTKMKIEVSIDWTNFSKETLISKLNSIPNSVKIKLRKLYFCSEDIEDKFWKSVLKFNHVIIKFDNNEFIRIRKELRSDQWNENSSSFIYWTKKTEEQINFNQLLQYLEDHINKSPTNN